MDWIASRRLLAHRPSFPHPAPPASGTLRSPRHLYGCSGNPQSVTLVAAGSCMGGFRTPAPCPTRAASDGRRPKTFAMAALLHTCTGPESGRALWKISVRLERAIDGCSGRLAVARVQTSVSIFVEY